MESWTDLLFCYSIFSYHLMAECTMMGSIWTVIVIWLTIVVVVHAGSFVVLNGLWHCEPIIEATTVVVTTEDLFQRNRTGNGQCNLTDDQSFASDCSQCFQCQRARDTHGHQQASNNVATGFFHCMKWKMRERDRERIGKILERNLYQYHTCRNKLAKQRWLESGGDWGGWRDGNDCFTKKKSNMILLDWNTLWLINGWF